MKKIIILVIGLTAVLSLWSMQVWADTTTPSAIVVGICAMEGNLASQDANSFYFTEGGRYGLNELIEKFGIGVPSRKKWGLSLGELNGDGTYIQGRVPVSINTGWSSDENSEMTSEFLSYAFSDESVLNLVAKQFVTVSPGTVTITIGLTARGKHCMEKGEPLRPGLQGQEAAQKFREKYPEIAAIHDTPGQKISVTFTIYDDSSVPFDVSLTEVPASVNAGDDVVIKASAVNNTEASQNVLLIAALYNHNEMVQLHLSPADVAARSSSELEIRFKLEDDTSGYRIKIFLWDKLYDPASSTGGRAFKDVKVISIN